MMPFKIIRRGLRRLHGKNHLMLKYKFRVNPRNPRPILFILTTLQLFTCSPSIEVRHYFTNRTS